MARENPADAKEKYNRAKEIRRGHETQFRMNAAYCLPRDYSRWQMATPYQAGQNSNDMQARFAFDNTGVRCIPKYVAICKRLINPDNIKYHKLTADNADLMRIPAVRSYFQNTTDLLFSYRHTPSAGFGTAQAEMYASLGVYGTGPKQLTWNNGGFLYRARPLYDVYFLIDDDGRTSDAFRRFSLSRRQFKLKWPEHSYPACLANLQDSDTTQKEFAHMVSKRGGDYDPKALDARRHKWISSYLCVDDTTYVGEEEGFISNPYLLPRAGSIAGDPYGYSPAEQAFPALGGVNAMKKTVIKQGQKAVDPTILANDDGALSGRIDLRPNRVIYGGIDSQGRKMVSTLDTGSNFQVAEKLIQDERNDINDSFLVTLFQILMDTPEMTAAEVYERISEKSALFAPTKAAIQEEDQGPQISRELDLLAENGKLPQAPPELIEARGEYVVSYTNPSDNALHAAEVAGFMRWSGMAVEAATATQDPEPLDWINWDAAMPDIGEKMDVRNAWINDHQAVLEKRKNRADELQKQQAIQAAPAVASVASSVAKQGAGAQA